MIVPRFWAEARLHQTRGRAQRQITVRRFGWSDLSQADAQTLANERAQAAFQRVVSGEKLPRREPKVPYNGAQGVPIREEVLARHDDVVITRNAYGAHCLNTPDVLFADLDFEAPVSGRLALTCALLLLAGAIGFSLWFDLGKRTFLVAFIAVLFTYSVAGAVHKTRLALRGGIERLQRQRINAFLRDHPGWHVALYRTPAGFRILALHALFDPTSPAVADAFRALGVDRLYAAMCRNQHCFRARVTAKPWRIGIAQHMRPRPGVWPVRPQQLEKRNAWIRTYEDAAPGFAACRFLESLGSGTVHPKAARVRDLHDSLAQALSGRDIA